MLGISDVQINSMLSVGIRYGSQWYFHPPLQPS